MLRTMTGLMRDDDRWVGRVLLAMMAIGFASLIGVGLEAWHVSGENRSHGSWVKHTYDVEVAIARTGTLLERSEAVRRGYLIAGQPLYLATYRRYAAELAPAIDRIGFLTADNPLQQANVARLRALTAGIAAEGMRTVALVGAGQRPAAQALFAAETGARRMRAVRALMDRMTSEEERLLAVRDASLSDSQRRFNVVLAVAGVLLATVALVSLIAVLRFTRDLTASRDVLRHLNDTLEDQVAERTADLRRANEEIQRFAYIVSHDLRSPLVNVMGFTAELEEANGALVDLVGRVEAEAPALLDPAARIAAREDLPEAIGFIRTSTQKMDRLINAILKLSREGRRVLAPEPLDLAGIADAAVAAMRHLIDERGVEVSVERPMPPVASDRLAVEQILSNLIENATKYLQPGRPGRVTVSARAARDRVVVAVADNGRGIAPADHQRIFDLFRRSGAQDQPGEGIGLAHVRALAYRLGGTVDVRSAPGEGATFRLTLPAAFTPVQDASA